MLDNVMRLREPAAWTVLAVTAATIVLAVVRFVIALGAGVHLAVAAQDMALTAMNLTLVILVVALVWVCVFAAPTRGAGKLVGVAAALVTLGTLLTIAGTLIGASASAGTVAVILEVLGGLLDIVLKVVATITLWLILRGMRGGRIATHGSAATADAAAPVVLEAEPDAGTEVVPAHDAPAHAPAPWQPDPTAGTVWASAQDAAQGAPGAPGTPGASGPAQPAQGGWHPVPRPEQPEPGEPGPRP